MLPENNISLIPKYYKDLYDKYQEYQAWYSNDVPYLRTLTYTNYSKVPERRFSYYENYYRNSGREYLHVPLASDISNTSSTMLLGDEIKVTIPGLDEETVNSEIIKTQDRLEYIINRGKIHNKLLEASESCSALGGIYIKVDYDQEIIDVPFLSVVRADLAIPKFKYGFLTGVCFIKEIDCKEDNIYYRLVEDREKGRITFGLYKGTDDNLGYQIPLTYHPATADYPEEIITNIDDLMVRYIPNVLPNRQTSSIPVGRSDYEGVEYLFNAIDITYTAWLREIRLGQSRIIVPETWLQRTDPANGNTFRFDVDREIFTALDIDPMSNQGLTVAQFDLRVEEFQQTCKDYMTTAISMAGYSPQSFGIDINGKAESGTALNIRERKSLKTTREKQTFFKDDLEDLFWLLLAVDNNLNNSGNYIEETPMVEFQDALSFDMNRIADTLTKLNQAQAASIKTKVELIHPDWSNEDINTEVNAIMQEQGIMSIEASELFSQPEHQESIKITEVSEQEESKIKAQNLEKEIKK